jgi:predicted RNA binding protein YcfA (HicA-like mRNA interferase family)
VSRLTTIHCKKFEKFLFRIGCSFVRQKGDHRIYRRADLKRPVVIPTEKDIPIFIIRNNLRVLGISVEEYLKMLAKI